jgi:large subunit ribosomal protein L35
MPKMKSHSGAKKRFHITGSGELRRMKGSRGHNKTKKKRRQLYAMAEMHPVQTRGMRKKINRLLPYGV